MKRLIMLAIPCLCMAMPCNAADDKAAQYFVVQVTSFSGAATNYVMTAAELNVKQKEIQVELTVFEKALKLAAEEWKSEEVTKNRAFPKAQVKKRSAKVLWKSADQGKAVERLASENEKIQDRKAQDEKEKKRVRDTMKMSEEMIKEEEKRDKENESRHSLARKMVQNKIEDLLGITSAKAATNAPAAKNAATNAPAAKPEEKKK